MPYVHIEVKVYEDATWNTMFKHSYMKGGFISEVISHALAMEILKEMRDTMSNYNLQRKKKRDGRR
jgi:hypothetical protein